MLSRVLPAFLILSVLTAGAQAAAPSSTAQKQELNALRNRIDTLQKTLAASEETKNEAVDALRESERAISESNRLLRELAEDQRAVNARLADLRFRLPGFRHDERHVARLDLFRPARRLVVGVQR